MKMEQENPAKASLDAERTGAEQQLGAHVTIRVEEATTSQDKYKRLQREAEEAARAGHLEAQVRVPGHAATAIPLWDELRIWDPGD